MSKLIKPHLKKKKKKLEAKKSSSCPLTKNMIIPILYLESRG
jgi:hypothetical protein